MREIGNAHELVETESTRESNHGWLLDRQVLVIEMGCGGRHHCRCHSHSGNCTIFAVSESIYVAQMETYHRSWWNFRLVLNQLFPHHWF